MNTQALKYWTTAILIDISMIAFFYLWQVDNFSWAGNVLHFFSWAITVSNIILGLLVDKTHFQKDQRPAGFIYYHAITDVIFIGAFAAIGEFWLAGFYLFGALGAEAARKREPKQKVAS